MTTNPFVLVNANIRDQETMRLSGNLAGAERVLRDTGASLDALQEELQIGENGHFDLSTINSIPGSGGEKMEKIVELHSHMAAAQHVINECRALAHSAEWRQRLQAGAGDADDRAELPAPRSLAQAVEQASPDGLRHFQGIPNGQTRSIDLPDFGPGVLGANFVTSDGIPPDNRRSSRVSPDFADYHNPYVTDLLGPMIPTDQAAIIYLQESINYGKAANQAAEAAEAAKENELDISYANVTDTVRAIRADIPVSQEQLDDVATTRSLLEGRLRRLAQLRLDSQVIFGNGTAPNLTGIVSTTGVVTQKTVIAANAWTGTSAISEVRLAMTKTRSNGMTPASGLCLNPEVWASIQLVQSNGQYVFGSPAILPAHRLWGLPVVEHDNFANVGTDGNNYGLVGDFAASADIYLRQGATVDAGWISDDFAKWLTRLRVTMRAAFALYTPKAFAILQRDYS